MRRPRASMAPAMPDTAWVLASDAEAWETHARACFAAFVEGECPLDVTRKNILNFSQGSFSLVEADLRATLPADLAAAVPVGGRQVVVTQISSRSRERDDRQMRLRVG